jgi:hypothetical protein
LDIWACLGKRRDTGQRQSKDKSAQHYETSETSYTSHTVKIDT